MQDDINQALDEISNQEVKVSFGELDVGHMYRIRKLDRTEATVHGKKIDGLRANLDIGDEAVKLFTYLPNAMKNMKAVLFNEINASAERQVYYGLCFYGSMGSSNIGKIHKPGEEPDANLLSRLERKRPWSNDPLSSSAKCSKLC